jgi:hypothetical protein
MIRSSPRRFWPAGFAGSLACLLFVSFLRPPGILAVPLTMSEVQRLIRDLGSDRFEVREAATKKLREMDEAFSALNKARKSPDSEVRRRAAEILLALEHRRALRGLARAKVLSQTGRIVEAVDRIAAGGKWDPKGDAWDSLTRFADRVIEDTADYFPANGSFRANPDFPVGEFRRFADRVHPKEICKRTIAIDARVHPPQFKKVDFDRRSLYEANFHLLLRGEEVSWLSDMPECGMITGILAASGDVQLVGARDSILIAGGDVKKVGYLFRSILVCDGDVELLRPPDKNCLIVARGKVTCASGKLSKCVVHSGHSLRLLDGKTIDLSDGTPDPLAFVKFFELADVGLTAADQHPRQQPDAEGVLLKDVSKDSPFTSRLRAKDEVTAIDGTKVTSTENFRRLLRRKLAQGGPILTFTVRRAKETLDVPISIKD